MFRFLLLYLLPLVLCGQRNNNGIKYYGTSNVRYQKPHPLRLPLRQKPQSIPILLTTVATPIETRIVPEVPIISNVSVSSPQSSIPTELRPLIVPLQRPMSKSTLQTKNAPLVVVPQPLLSATSLSPETAAAQSFVYDIQHASDRVSQLETESPLQSNITLSIFEKISNPLMLRVSFLPVEEYDPKPAALPYTPAVTAPQSPLAAKILTPEIAIPGTTPPTVTQPQVSASHAIIQLIQNHQSSLDAASQTFLNATLSAITNATQLSTTNPRASEVSLFIPGMSIIKSETLVKTNTEPASYDDASKQKIFRLPITELAARSKELTPHPESELTSYSERKSNSQTETALLSKSILPTPGQFSNLLNLKPLTFVPVKQYDLKPTDTPQTPTASFNRSLVNTDTIPTGIAASQQATLASLQPLLVNAPTLPVVTTPHVIIQQNINSQTSPNGTPLPSLNDFSLLSPPAVTTSQLALADANQLSVATDRQFSETSHSISSISMTPETPVGPEKEPIAYALEPTPEPKPKLVRPPGTNVILQSQSSILTKSRPFYLPRRRQLLRDRPIRPLSKSAPPLPVVPQTLLSATTLSPITDTNQFLVVFALQSEKDPVSQSKTDSPLQSISNLPTSEEFSYSLKLRPTFVPIEESSSKLAATFQTSKGTAPQLPVVTGAPLPEIAATLSPALAGLQASDIVPSIVPLVTPTQPQVVSASQTIIQVIKSRQSPLNVASEPSLHTNAALLAIANATQLSVDDQQYSEVFHSVSRIPLTSETSVQPKTEPASYEPEPISKQKSINSSKIELISQPQVELSLQPISELTIHSHHMSNYQSETALQSSIKTNFTYAQSKSLLPSLPSGLASFRTSETAFSTVPVAFATQTPVGPTSHAILQLVNSNQSSLNAASQPSLHTNAALMAIANATQLSVDDQRASEAFHFESSIPMTSETSVQPKIEPAYIETEPILKQKTIQSSKLELASQPQVELTLQPTSELLTHSHHMSNHQSETASQSSITTNFTYTQSKSLFPTQPSGHDSFQASGPAFSTVPVAFATQQPVVSTSHAILQLVNSDQSSLDAASQSSLHTDAALMAIANATQLSVDDQRTSEASHSVSRIPMTSETSVQPKTEPAYNETEAISKQNSIHSSKTELTSRPQVELTLQPISEVTIHSNHISNYQSETALQSSINTNFTYTQSKSLFPTLPSGHASFQASGTAFSTVPVAFATQQPVVSTSHAILQLVNSDQSSLVAASQSSLHTDAALMAIANATQLSVDDQRTSEASHSMSRIPMTSETSVQPKTEPAYYETESISKQKSIHSSKTELTSRPQVELTLQPIAEVTIHSNHMSNHQSETASQSSINANYTYTQSKSLFPTLPSGHASILVSGIPLSSETDVQPKTEPAHYAPEPILKQKPIYSLKSGLTSQPQVELTFQPVSELTIQSRRKSNLQSETALQSSIKTNFTFTQSQSILPTPVQLLPPTLTYLQPLSATAPIVPVVTATQQQEVTAPHITRQQNMSTESSLNVASKLPPNVPSQPTHPAATILQLAEVDATQLHTATNRQGLEASYSVSSIPITSRPYYVPRPRPMRRDRPVRPLPKLSSQKKNTSRVIVSQPLLFATTVSPETAATQLLVLSALQHKWKSVSKSETESSSEKEDSKSETESLLQSNSTMASSELLYSLKAQLTFASIKNYDTKPLETPQTPTVTAPQTLVVADPLPTKTVPSLPPTLASFSPYLNATPTLPIMTATQPQEITTSHVIIQQNTSSQSFLNAASQPFLATDDVTQLSIGNDRQTSEASRSVLSIPITLATVQPKTEPVSNEPQPALKQKLISSPEIELTSQPQVELTLQPVIPEPTVHSEHEAISQPKTSLQSKSSLLTLEQFSYPLQLTHTKLYESKPPQPASLETPAIADATQLSVATDRQASEAFHSISSIPMTSETSNQPKKESTSCLQEPEPTPKPKLVHSAETKLTSQPQVELTLQPISESTFHSERKSNSQLETAFQASINTNFTYSQSKSISPTPEQFLPPTLAYLQPSSAIAPTVPSVTATQLQEVTAPHIDKQQNTSTESSLNVASQLSPNVRAAYPAPTIFQLSVADATPLRSATDRQASETYYSVSSIPMTSGTPAQSMTEPTSYVPEPILKLKVVRLPETDLTSQLHLEPIKSVPKQTILSKRDPVFQTETLPQSKLFSIIPGQLLDSLKLKPHLTVATSQPLTFVEPQPPIRPALQTTVVYATQSLVTTTPQPSAVAAVPVKAKQPVSVPHAIMQLIAPPQIPLNIPITLGTTAPESSVASTLQSTAATDPQSPVTIDSSLDLLKTRRITTVQHVNKPDSFAPQPERIQEPSPVLQTEPQLALQSVVELGHQINENFPESILSVYPPKLKLQPSLMAVPESESKRANYKPSPAAAVSPSLSPRPNPIPEPTNFDRQTHHTTEYLFTASVQRVTETPPVITSTAVPLKPGSLKLDFMCKERNGYYAVNNECDTYIQCKEYNATKLSCPHGFYFNPTAKYDEYPCAHQAEVKCIAGTEKQEPPPTGECVRQYGLFPMNNGECSKYIMCNAGVATIMNCPHGLVFNPTIKGCDWPATMPQCNPQVFNDYICPNPIIDDSSLDSGMIFKYKYGQDCKLFIACQRGYPRLLSCESGLAFDEASQSCIKRDYVPNCITPNGI